MFDTDFILEDGAAAKTASGYGQSGGEAAVANVGDGLIKANLVVDVSQMAMADNDEIYQLHLLGGDDASFTNEVSLATLEIGAREVVEGNRDGKFGRYILPFQNEQNGVVFPYVRIRHFLGGTTPTVNYVSRLEKDLPVRGMIFPLQTTTTT